MAAAFSTADAAIIEHEVELDADAVAHTAAASGRALEDVYDIAATAEALVAPDGCTIEPPLARVALQFPDEALVDSVPVLRALDAALQHRTRAPPRLYILADTSYGACCVDEVAAAHVEADAVVHYGHTCLSPTARLPALYVFPKHNVDVRAAAAGLADAAAAHLALHDPPRAVVFTYDVAYAHAAADVFRELRAVWKHDTPLMLSQIDTHAHYAPRIAQRAPRHQHDGWGCSGGCGPCGSCGKPPAPAEAPRPSLLGARRIDAALDGTAALYLGGESRALTHLLLTLGPTYRLASYDPKTACARAETGRTNRLLMRRYATIQKARDASVVGLVIGTLGIHAYLPLLRELRRMLTAPASQRKVYTISVGKLNPAKLANFQEVDVFVLVACPENSLLDTRDFLRPIVTPWEMMLAVQARGDSEVAWSGAYVLDLDRVLADTAALDLDTRDDRPHYSFATGEYVSRTRYGTGDDEPAGAPEERALQRVDAAPHELTVRDPATGQLCKVLDSAALAHRGTRTWHGLDPTEGTQSGPARLEQGSVGFAQHYRAADGASEGTR